VVQARRKNLYIYKRPGALDFVLKSGFLFFISAAW
jgi:hypothetical protein